MSNYQARKHSLRQKIRLTLIERLNTPWEAMGDMANEQRAEAAEQIKAMMDELKELRRMLEFTNEMAEHYAQERDEARREVCNNEAKHLPTMADPHMEAKRRGWDCFKEKP